MPHFDAERALLVHQIANRLEEIHATIYRQRTPITGWETVIAGEQQDVAPPPANGWQPYSPGDPWGGPDATQWFRAKVTIPSEMAGETVVALLQSGGESLCYLNGLPAQGLDPNRQEVVLFAQAEGGEALEIMIEAYAHGRSNFSLAQLAVRDTLAWSFYWDLKVAHETVAVLPEHALARMQLQDLVDRSIKRVDLNNVSDLPAYHADLEDAQKRFRAKLRKFRNSQGMGKALLVGHSHIDTAWLWRLRETRRKLGRTFSSVLKYMEEYPEYCFSQSQAQLYEYAKEHYPSLYERIKERVREGRWEPIGAAWVEQDTNVPSGEAHVRQFLYGNRFFRKEFGIHTRNFWLPDCFGFSFAMPQIMKKAQIDAFATTKLLSNEYNQFPYTMFRWRGLDGTEVLAYQLPGICNMDVTPGSMVGYWDAFREKHLSDEIPVSYGHGDGGGGPTPQMLENGLRLKNMVGVPRTEFGTLQGHFDRITKSVDWESLPVYHDELYYEKHRGCQTTQARTKRNNRKSELGLRDAEFLSALAMLGGGTYPQDALYDAWKLVLLNQFHDILPGSSIGPVYEDAEKDYAKVLGSVGRVREAALRALAAKVDTHGEGEPVLVVNTLGWARSDVACLDIDAAKTSIAVLDPNGRPAASQVVRKPDGRPALLFEASDVPSMGCAVYRIVNGAKPVRNRLKASETRLENEFFVVGLSKKGTIRRLYDKKNGREVLPRGAEANELVLFDDRPASSDAWDIDHNIDERRQPVDEVVAVSVTETGPVRATVRVVKKTERSTITQDISLWRTIPRIDFVTSVEWWEKRRLMKACFPVEVLSRTATYEIQYGAIERPTHRSNSVERARFEVTGHKWIDLSEGDYGVSLLNDCKYGFDVYQNTMRISLLRSPIVPDPHADEGHHESVYSLYPHRASWREAETVRRAYELNVPLIARIVDAHAGSIPAASGFLSADQPNVVIDAVKKAEDSDALIVRLYEAHGARGPVRLSFGASPKSVTECDLMEENDVPVACEGSTVSFVIKPWEIRTFKVVM